MKVKSDHRSKFSNGNAEVMGSNPVEALNFFRLLLSSCLNWKIYCDDHSLLSLHLSMLSPRVGGGGGGGGGGRGGGGGLPTGN